MSIIAQRSFLGTPLSQVLQFYHQYIFPRLARDKKIITISITTALAFYVLVDKLFGAPKKLRHIPYQSYYSFFKSIFNGEDIIQQTENFRLPLINSPTNNGIYMVPGRGGWVIHIANPIDAKYVLMKHDKFPKITLTGDLKESFLGKYVGDNVATTNGAHWRSQRMVANPAFRVSMPVKLFGQLTSDLFKVIDNSNNLTVDFSDLMGRWTLDAIGKAGFGFDFKAISEENNQWVNTYDTINKGLQDPFYYLLPILDTRFLWLSSKRQAVHKELDRFNDMLEHIIHSKREAIEKRKNQNESLEENEKDLLTLMIEAEAKGEGIMSNKELRDNLAMFFLAGHDTTSYALSFAIYYLAIHPDIQQKAREESLTILGDQQVDVIPTIEDTKRMAYINQIIKETLRINGPVPQVIPRIAAEDTILSGTLIPKGSCLTVDLYNIHHSDKVWKNVYQFDPERFVENGESDTLGEGMTWVPFGSGPRQCIGMNFSLAEQRVLLSMMLRKYSWELPNDSIHKDKLFIKGMTTVGPKNLEIRFKRLY